MKYIKIVLPFLIAVVLIGCDHNVKMETVVNVDGSIDRTIILQDDSSTIDNNYFGINKNNGWDVALAIVDTSKHNEVQMTFKKHFASVEESNRELNNDNDTLFHIESKFEKRFRWFYTYTTYSDTYKAIDRFKLLNQQNYLTPEDYQFMDRLPPEGDSISKADELFLEDLTTKINDVLVPNAVYEEHFAVFENMIARYQLEPRWMDTLQHHKESIFKHLLKHDDLGEDGLMTVLDSLHVPFPHPQVDEDYKNESKPIEARFDFMSYANNGKYIHSIQMPGEIIDSNADSLVSNYAFWKPNVFKFLANDYTMYAETRKLNLWALIVSVLVLMATVYVFVRKR